MSKQKAFQKFIYKLHSQRLADSKYDLSLPLEEAIDNKTDIVELSDSQVLRFIDEIRGVDTFAVVKELKEEIKRLKAGERTSAVNRKIKSKYLELYKTQFQKDYVCIVMDNMKQYDRCNKGFSINGIKYKRFLGTNGGIKNSTIIYVSEEIYPELKERLDCGRNKEMKFIPAKLEAYQALICSGSIPVSMPNGIIVVKDCMTKFKADAIYIDDSESDEPVVTEIEKEIERDASDGFGFMTPELSMRWSGELNGEPEKYLSAVNTRGIPWTKGMLFTFDFVKFCGEVAENYWIQDVWGDWRDVREAEVILTESMLKLWESYDSWEEYWANVEKYHYGFAVAKTAPYELEEERQTNYQFLQSYELTDADIEELVSPTVDTIREVIGLDYRKAILYMKGVKINPESVLRKGAGIAEALMVEPELINDSYVRTAIYDSIKTRIKRAKTGVLDVHGNFAIIGGDLYSLAQSMCGLEVTGLLPAGVVWHKFWMDRGIKEVCCFRAPMTSHNNIIKQVIASPDTVENFDEMQEWYQYIETCMLFNSWDTTAERLNGADFDGDISFTTECPVLLNNTRSLPPIFCIQRKGEKKVPTEDDIVYSNKMSFGDAIGATTNVITSQICALAKFPPGSREYEVLSYRVLTGQHYQQCEIDKAKGIIAKPMPKYWYNLKNKKVQEFLSRLPEDDVEFIKRIAVDRKPYFFIYNYDHLFSRYKKFLKRADTSAQREFGKTLDHLLTSGGDTEDEKRFIEYYYKYIPVDNAPCAVNRICWYIEDNLVPPALKQSDKPFDYTILKSPDKPYSDKQYYYVKPLLEKEYKTYRIGVKDLAVQLKDLGIHGNERARMLEEYGKAFLLKANIICPDDELRCDVLLDIAYKSNTSKRFVWIMCGRQIITNLLRRHGYEVSFPEKSEVGKPELYFKGEGYSMSRYYINPEDADEAVQEDTICASSDTEESDTDF